MLKKAGIVVAAAAAGLLAVSPLAFAGDKGYDDHDGHTTVSDNNTNSVSGDENVGLINVTGNNVNAPIQGLNCNDVQVGLIQGQIDDVTAQLTGALALFGDAHANSEQNVDNSCNSVQGDSGAGDLVEQGIDD
ncbi:MAG: hypothetical protein L0I24_06810 [Pseudonocardia sp.]|nr:hypothetical protein [Pseudonocardia sp.]